MPINYVDLAAEALLELIDREDAVVWPEAEAKLGEARYRSPSGIVLPAGINPNHLLAARQELVRAERLEEVREETRGQTPVTVLGLRDRNRLRRKVAFDRAAARKRLLHGRYLGWAATSSKHPNLIGLAGERVAHASLVEAAAAGVGYHIVSPRAGHVPQLFGAPVPGGALDDAAYLTAIAPATGFPLVVVVPIEVKNVRHWIFPRDNDLWQLLHKAAHLQETHPELQFIPVLVARRAHYTTFRMAKDLGFVVADMHTQPILAHGEAPLEAVREVNAELGYNLVGSADANPRVTKILRESVPALAARAVNRWTITARLVAPVSAELRSSAISNRRRATLLELVRAGAQAQIPGAEGGW